jgi:hypothetical protein
MAKEASFTVSYDGKALEKHASETENEMITENKYEVAYSIVSLAFKEKDKWRLYDGQSTISASIKDEEFLEKVNNNSISFAKNDMLICDVKVTQISTKEGLKIEYDVIKVKEHRLAPLKSSLFEDV